jgi:tRNA pseudouridine32 synthase/23S rRNA pseudouridine746 synthase/23S rRNA pseudouridine1911/1915/1917 synthase
MPKPSKPRTRFLPRGLVILHEDQDILVVDKPAGLLTMGTDSEQERTVYFSLTAYVRKGYAKSRNRIFIVHRLDRDASGLLIFAKNEAAKRQLQAQWPETKKTYVAVVHGRLEQPEATISSYLLENAAHRVYSTADTRKGYLSHTAYKVVKQAKDLALLEIDLLTGRKHQIRVHLAESGHPIVGDRRYSKDGGAYKRMALHALALSFKHPASGKELTFATEVPDYFQKLMGGVEAKSVNSSPAQHR